MNKKTEVVKPELLVTAGSLEEAARLFAAGANALQIGESRYGLRLPGEFRLPEIREAVKLARQHQGNIYVTVNKLFQNDELSELPGYLTELAEIGADAVIFGDPAVLIAMRTAGVSLPLHWNPEMTATNSAAVNYWGEKGAVRAVLARELNLEEILEIKRNTRLEVQVQVHGMTNIFHSKRLMVSNYLEHIGNRADRERIGPERGLYLKEGQRPEETYPIYEDVNGTHIMSPDDICMIEDLHELLNGGIDSFKIEGLMKTADYNETVVRVYREAIDAYAADPQGYRFREEWLERIQAVQPPDRPLSFGFFYKVQVY